MEAKYKLHIQQVLHIEYCITTSTWFSQIFTISVFYLATRCLHVYNMGIKQVIMLWNILLCLMSKKVASFYNLNTLLGLWTK